MFRKPTREERFGCLFSILGMLVGPIVFLTMYPPPPGECGLGAVAGTMIGACMGTPAGAVFGMALSHLLPRE